VFLLRGETIVPGRGQQNEVNLLPEHPVKRRAEGAVGSTTKAETKKKGVEGGEITEGGGQRRTEVKERAPGWNLTKIIQRVRSLVTKSRKKKGGAEDKATGCLAWRQKRKVEVLETGGCREAGVRLKRLTHSVVRSSGRRMNFQERDVGGREVKRGTG